MGTATTCIMHVVLRYKKGDIVRFISGGPKMIVLEPSLNEEYPCKWYSEIDGLYHEAVFPEYQLMPA